MRAETRPGAILQPRSRGRLLLLLVLTCASLLLELPPAVLPVSGASWASPSGTVLEGPGLTLTALNVTCRMQVNGTDVGEMISRLRSELQQQQQANAQLSTGVEAAEATVAALQSRLNATKAQITALLTPTSVQATAGDGQAEVRWAMAATTVTASPGGANCTADGLGGEQQCTVRGLTNGVEYTFTAQITNGAGAGAVSPPSNAVTPMPMCNALTVATAGDGGQVAASPTSSAGCAPGKYSPGEVVTVTAIPDARFGVAWSGPDSGVSDDAQLTFTLTIGGAPTSVVASFAPCVAVTLALASPTGTGAVEALPTHSPGCASGSFTAGSRVILRAKPADGWLFGGSAAQGFAQQHEHNRKEQCREFC